MRKRGPAPSKHPVAGRVLLAVQGDISSHPRWGGTCHTYPPAVARNALTTVSLPSPVLARLMVTRVHESPIWGLNPGRLLH